MKYMDLYGDPRQEGFKYLLDAQTENCERRTLACERDMVTIMADFQKWISDNELHGEDIWYSHVFLVDGPRHIANLSVGDDGVSVNLDAVKDSKVRFKIDRKPGLRRRVRNLKEKVTRLAG